MNLAPASGKEGIEQLIVQYIPRDVLMACEDAYHNGDEKARGQASKFAKGHLPSAAGQIKHFYINEAFFEALEVHGAEPTPLRGTQLVIGRLGIFNIARLNVPGHKWVNLRKSSTRNKLAAFNDMIDREYVQKDLFASAAVPTRGTIFIIGVMGETDANGIAKLSKVMIALPAPGMKSWLYESTITDFLTRYDQTDTVVQPDNAVPLLKSQPKKRTGNDQGN